MLSATQQSQKKLDRTRLPLKKNPCLTGISVVILLLCSVTSVWSENYYVDSQNGQNNWTGNKPTYQGELIGPKATIAAAIDIARDGDVIILASGRYQGRGNRDLQIIAKSITLRSESDWEYAIIDCGGRPGEAHQGITIEDTEIEVVLEGLWIINGYGPRGGGLSCNNSNVTIVNCVFSNHKMNSGGGIYSSTSNLNIERCAFWGNISSYSGGGIDCWHSDLKISDSLISGNRAGSYGGAISTAVSSNVEITNCTISQNQSGLYGGGIFCRHESSVSVSHTILWEDQSQKGSEIALLNRANRPSEISVAYCDVQGDQEEVYREQGCEINWNKGNFSENPLFVESGQWDYNGTADLPDDDLWLTGDLHLQNHSPCVDAGSTDFQPAQDAKDFDGYSRMVKGWIDIGAYEVQLDGDWIVDDDSIYDPGPGNRNLSDPQEDGSNLRPFDTIQEAIDAAQNGDSIVVRDGLYQGMGNRDMIIEGKSLTISSENGAKRTTIDCERLGQGFYLDQITEGNIVLDGLTITRGWAARGGGIHCRNSSATITNCIITDNQATSCGGGIYCEGDLDQDSFPIICNNQITGNKANGPGGGIDIYYFNVYPSIAHNLIAGNQSALRGGGISIFTTNTPAVIINNTITSNRCPMGGGISFYATSDSLLSNCIIWDNEAEKGTDLHVQQFGKLFLSNVAIDYCNFSGGELAVPVSLESSVHWGKNNLTLDPCFTQPGYFNDNNTENYPYDDQWVDGNYHLNYRSAAIDAGNNNTLETLISQGVDTSLTFNEIIDLGAFEYRGIDPDRQGDSNLLRFNKVTLKAGRKPDSDSFAVSGELDGEMDESREIGELTVRVGPYVETLYAENIKWSKRGDKFRYKGRSGGITSAKVDLKNQTFMISAKGIDLTGLGENMLVELALGSYYGFGGPGEEVINAKKVVPIDFMSGFANTLRIGKVKAKPAKSNEGEPITIWTIRGEIALAQNDTDLSDYRLRTRWGTVDTALYSGDVAGKGSLGNYQYQRAKDSESAIVKAKFNLAKHTFTIVIEGDVAEISQPEFQLIFENNEEVAYDETVLVDLI